MLGLPNLRLFRSKRGTVAAAALGMAVLGWLDSLTGPEVAISAFYLLPISLVAWVLGRRAGLWTAALCTGVWWFANGVSGMDRAHRFILAWNALMLGTCFAAVAWLIGAFQRAHNHLESIVAERTAALEAEIAARQRLEHAKLQAERLAVAGTMAAQVAHEIRNPLGSITLNLDLMAKEVEALPGGGRSPEECRLLIHDMRDELARIQRVLGDYLAFSRLPRPNRAWISLNEMIEQKLPLLLAGFSRCRIEVCRQFDPMLPALFVDSGQIWQALLNLVQNAVDAMPEGGRLTLGTGRIGSDVVVRVSDTGGGMSAEQMDMVFRPFFSTKTRGTGLGLATTQQIISEHRGHIECSSARGRGSTFTVFLPMLEAAA